MEGRKSRNKRVLTPLLLTPLLKGTDPFIRPHEFADRVRNWNAPASSSICQSGCSALVVSTAVGYEFIASEFGILLVKDWSTGDMHEFYYASLGVGPSLGVGVVAIEFGGVVPTTVGQVAGLGYAFNGVMAAGPGGSVTAFGSFTQSHPVGFVAGPAAGVSTSATAHITYTWHTATNGE